MSRVLRFLFGMWIGANFLAYPMAAVLLYLFTGKVPLPITKKGRPHLVSPEEAITHAREVTDNLLEMYHG